MRKLMRHMAAVFLFAAVLSSCGDPIDPDNGGNDKPVTQGWTRGKMDSVLYMKYEPLNGKPVMLYYYIPAEGDIKTMKVLFTIHGTTRNADSQIGYWKSTADKNGVILLSPAFTKKYYNNLDFQYGGVSNYSDR